MYIVLVLDYVVISLKQLYVPLGCIDVDLEHTG